MNYEHLQNTAEEIENLSADDEKLRRMLGGLKKVSAPANFDFRLKARIANAKADRSPQPFLFPALRFVLPLSVIVLLAGFVIFNLSPSTGNQTDSLIVENAPTVQRETASPAPETVSPPALETAQVLPVSRNPETENPTSEIAGLNNKKAADKAKIPIVKNPADVRSDKGDDSKNGFGGVRQSASADAPVLFERANSSNSNAVRLPAIKQNKIPLRDVLSEIGIQAESGAGGWKILSIKENSLAMRAEMKAGDVIEAIGDEKLSSDTALPQNFSVKVFRILRDGKQIIVDLTAKR